MTCGMTGVISRKKLHAVVDPSLFRLCRGHVLSIWTVRPTAATAQAGVPYGNTSPSIFIWSEVSSYNKRQAHIHICAWHHLPSFKLPRAVLKCYPLTGQACVIHRFCKIWKSGSSRGQSALSALRYSNFLHLTSSVLNYSYVQSEPLVMSTAILLPKDRPYRWSLTLASRGFGAHRYAGLFTAPREA